MSGRRSEGACAKEFDIIAESEIGHFRLFGRHCESLCTGITITLFGSRCAFGWFYVLLGVDDVVPLIPRPAPQP